MSDEQELGLDSIGCIASASQDIIDTLESRILRPIEDPSINIEIEDDTANKIVETLDNAHNAIIQMIEDDWEECIIIDEELAQNASE